MTTANRTYPVTDSDTGAMVIGRASTEGEAIEIAKAWYADHDSDATVTGATLMLATLDAEPDINTDADLAEGRTIRAFVVRCAE